MFESEIFKSKFFGLYWHYFLIGSIIYVGARLMLNFFSKSKSPLMDSQNEEDVVENDSVSDDSAKEDEENYESFLPVNLKHVPLVHEKFPISETMERAEEFYQFMNTRRTVRHFSNESVPVEVLYKIIKTSATAPSGAHTQPWTYLLVSSDEMKQQVREIIEFEEEINYKKRMGLTWTTDIQGLKTNWVKEYITEAPYLILLFKQVYSYKKNGKKQLHYYNEQSVSIAAGMLLTAIHYAGLVSLTSTPLNCGAALRTLFGRPASEKLVLLLPVGYPTENCQVPDLNRKPLDEILVEF